MSRLDDPEYSACLQALLDDNPYTDPEPLLDYAMRTQNQALRCWIEEGNAPDKYATLKAEAKRTYMRLPVVSNSGLPAGACFIRTYDNQTVLITQKQAQKNPMTAFVAQ